MVNLFRFFMKVRHRSSRERRGHPRHASILRVDYLVQGSWYRGSIQNISEGGLYIRAIKEGDFFKGDSILMLVEFAVLRHQIRGKIVRVESHGIAVEFDTSEPGYSDLKGLLAKHCFF